MPFYLTWPSPKSGRWRSWPGLGPYPTREEAENLATGWVPRPAIVEAHDAAEAQRLTDEQAQGARAAG